MLGSWALEARSRVPEEFRGLFVDERKFMDHMKSAASSQKFSESVYRMIVGQRKLIDMYLSGVLNKDNEDVVADAEADILGNRRQTRDNAQRAPIVFNRKQRLFEEAVNENARRLRLGLKGIKVMLIGVNRAHLYGVLKEDEYAYIELPGGAARKGKCGRLWR